MAQMRRIVTSARAIAGTAQDWAPCSFRPRRTRVRSSPMSEVPGQPRSRAAGYGNRFQVTAVVIAIIGVALLTVAAFVVSYAGIR